MYNFKNWILNEHKSEYSDHIDYSITIYDGDDRLEWNFEGDSDDSFGMSGDIDIEKKRVSFFLQGPDFTWYNNYLNDIDTYIKVIKSGKLLIQCFPNGEIRDDIGDIYWVVPFEQFSRSTRLKLEDLV